MVDNKINIEEYKRLKLKEQPLPARRIELGGDYYFKCYWITCDADVNRFNNYCSNCGQHLSFEVQAKEKASAFTNAQTRINNERIKGMGTKMLSYKTYH